MKALLALALLVHAGDLTVSTRTAAKWERYDVEAGLVPGDRRGGAALAVGMRLKEGKPLQMMFWGASGAVIGGIAGPPGAVIGAAAGLVTGWIVSVFVVPRTMSPEGPSSASSRAAKSRFIGAARQT